MRCRTGDLNRVVEVVSYKCRSPVTTERPRLDDGQCSESDDPRATRRRVLPSAPTQSAAATASPHKAIVQTAYQNGDPGYEVITVLALSPSPSPVAKAVYGAAR